MYARVTTVQGSPDKAEEGVAAFNNDVLPLVKGLKGYKAAFLLIDRSSGKGLGISIWESEAAREAAGEAVAQARASTIQAMGGAIPEVELYEVASSDI